MNKVMKKCPFCGADLKDDSLFCTECGKSISQVKSNGKNAKLLIICLIIAVCGVGIWFFLGNKNGSSSSGNDSDKKIEYISTFYSQFMKNSSYDDNYIKENLTDNGLKILREHNKASEGGDEEEPDGIASWLFNYFNGFTAVGDVVSRTVTPIDSDNFLVTSKYTIVEEYKVQLTVIIDGDSYKIDNIQPQGIEYVIQ